MERFDLIVTVLVVSGLITLNIFPGNNLVTWLALIVTGLLMILLFAYHIILRDKPCRKHL